MLSKWRKAQLAFRTKMCLLIPGASEESAAQPSDTVSLSPSTPSWSSVPLPDMPSTPVPTSSGLRLPRHSSKSSKNTCAICLATMKPGHGQAIFTAECSHSFHFHCITSNVKHGSQMCPICRAKWKEIPFQSPANEITRGRARNSVGAWPQGDQWVTVLRRLPSPRTDTTSPRQVSSIFHAAEPSIFDDDELVISQPETRENLSAPLDGNSAGTLDLEAYPEVSAVSRSECHRSFTILVHMKAPSTSRRENFRRDQSGSRVAVDLVTVLDVSGSMAGTKIALLKRAMGFVIQNLGPYDRLSVIAFSSTARRLFPLRRMTDIGKQEALQLVNSLTSTGGTNIVEGLKKGAKVMTDRKSKNSVSSIILLSDGQDTYNRQPAYESNESLLPVTMHRDNSGGIHVPVHAFGFGIDHDAVSMHSISESSGGTFSFIEAENVIQDAFAQCIGGILSVVAQEVVVDVECLHPSLRLSSIKAGSYRTSIMSGSRKGSVEVGDLYAEEERDFLVSVDIPVEERNDEMSVLKIKCVYKDPVSKELVTLNQAGEVKILRPAVTGELVVSMEVDRQRNRLRSAECMAEARAAAERGELATAVSVLENCRLLLAESVSYKAGDRLCASLDAELREMEVRMANRQVYETSGRAYVLSGMSSHSWQRATARGDSTDSTSLVQAYQTPSMVDMVTRSQTFSSPSPRLSLRPALSFPGRLSPR